MQTSTTVTSSGENAITILMTDHERIKELFEEMLNADGTTRRAILQRLKVLLVVHNATEENVIYPAIHEIAQRPQHANGLYHQQDDAQVAFWELQMLDPDDLEFLRKGSELLDALLAHVRKEEDTEFPHLREALTTEGMQKLTADVREFRSQFKGG